MFPIIAKFFFQINFRPIKKIKGMNGEVIVALVANIESMELRRSECQTRCLPPEHPRASSTDDLEGYFSVLHHLLGAIFDHKTFIENSPKITQEFVKKADHDLPFFHWTGINERFHEGPMVSFNVPSAEGIERLDRVTISRRADPGVFLANRVISSTKGKSHSTSSISLRTRKTSTTCIVMNLFLIFWN